MSTPERGRRRTDLFDERLARLHRLIHLNAPRNIIAIECELVVRAHFGGRAKFLFYVVLDALRHCWQWYAQIPFMRALCCANIYHMEQGPGEFGCPFCGKGENPEAPPSCEVSAHLLDGDGKGR